MDIANLGGFNIQEVNAVINKSRRAIEKDLEKEKTGKAIPMELWIKGEDYKKSSGSRPSTRKNIRKSNRTTTR